MTDYLQPRRISQSRTVLDIRKILDQYPDEYHVHAYEGESTGIVITAPEGNDEPNGPKRHEVAFIEARECTDG